VKPRYCIKRRRSYQAVTRHLLPACGYQGTNRAKKSRTRGYGLWKATEVALLLLLKRVTLL